MFKTWLAGFLEDTILSKRLIAKIKSFRSGPNTTSAPRIARTAPPVSLAWFLSSAVPPTAIRRAVGPSSHIAPPRQARLRVRLEEYSLTAARDHTAPPATALQAVTDTFSRLKSACAHETSSKLVQTHHIGSRRITLNDTPIDGIYNNSSIRKFRL